MSEPKPSSELNQDHTAPEELKKTDGSLTDDECDKVSGGGYGPYATNDGC